MSDESKQPQDDAPMQQLEELQKNLEEGEIPPKERFRKTSHIALLMAYDLIDKLRYWEKETLELPDDDQVDRRSEHMAVFIQQLREVYLAFADNDL